MTNGVMAVRRYVRPNIHLPVSLHDARVSALHVRPPSEKKQDGTVLFIFENGFIVINNTDISQTGRASVLYAGIDFDFSHVCYYKDSFRRAVRFDECAKDIRDFAFDIVDESYGYNRTRLTGILVTVDNWYNVDIELYHAKEAVYEWVDYGTDGQ